MMRPIAPKVLFAAGVSCAAVAIAKMMFGVAITLPFLPRIPLGWVNIPTALVLSAACLVSSAALSRAFRGWARTQPTPSAGGRETLQSKI